MENQNIIQEALQNEMLLVCEIMVNNQKRLGAMKSGTYKALTEGALALDRKMLNLMDVDKVYIGIRKLPFLRPYVTINPKRRIFLKSIETIYYMTRIPRVIQSHLISEVTLKTNANYVYESREEAIEMTKQELIDNYYDDIRSKRLELRESKIRDSNR